MDENILKLKKLVSESSNIVFLVEQEYLLKVEFQILEVNKGFIIQ